MSKWKPQVVKKSGAIQRSDVQLNKEVASTLVQMIFLGETLFPKQGYIEIGEEGGSVKKILCTTINKWIARDNVIPETKKTLRDLLNEARENYRIKKREDLKDKMIGDLDREFKRTLNLRTNIPVIGMFGKFIDKETGKIVRAESPNLLKIKMDIVKFLAERLDPERYGKVEKKEVKNLNFSLADLRKYKEAREAQGAE